MYIILQTDFREFKLIYFSKKSSVNLLKMTITLTTNIWSYVTIPKLSW